MASTTTYKFTGEEPNSSRNRKIKITAIIFAVVLLIAIAVGVGVFLSQPSHEHPLPLKDYNINDITASSAQIAWSSTDDADDISYYIIMYKQSDSNEKYKKISNVTDQFYTLTGLMPFTEYNFFVHAVNHNGPGPTSIWPLNFTTADTEGCPESEGFFHLPEENKCFKAEAFMEQKVDWTSAKSICESAGLVLAKPGNATELQKYMNDKYSETYGELWHWIGGRGDGRNMRWQQVAAIVYSGSRLRVQRRGGILNPRSPLWWPGHPEGLTTDHCLVMATTKSSMSIQSGHPYASVKCDWTYSPICERIME